MSQTVLILVFCLLISITGSYNAAANQLITTRGSGRKQPTTKTTLAERVDEMIQSSHARQRMISSHPRLRKKIYSTVEIPARVAAAPNMPGQFMAVFRVGTPPQEFMLVADTGNDLTWVNCNLGSSLSLYDHDQDAPRAERVFHANLSTSFKMLPCSSQICFDISYGCSQTSNPTPTTPCAYNVRYMDDSTSEGILVNETATLKLENGQEIELHDVLIGCSTSTDQYIPRNYGVPDGVLGLGYSKHSFVAQMLTKFGNKFSYCWGDITNPSNNDKNYLTFGSNSSSSLPSMQYTELVLKYEPYYTVKVTGISAGGVMLNISTPAGDIASFEGEVLVDSGSPFTLLINSAYEPVMAALRAPLLTKYGDSGE